MLRLHHSPADRIVLNAQRFRVAGAIADDPAIIAERIRNWSEAQRARGFGAPAEPPPSAARLVLMDDAGTPFVWSGDLGVPPEPVDAREFISDVRSRNSRIVAIEPTPAPDSQAHSPDSSPPAMPPEVPAAPDLASLLQSQLQALPAGLAASIPGQMLQSAAEGLLSGTPISALTPPMKLPGTGIGGGLGTGAGDMLREFGPQLLQTAVLGHLWSVDDEAPAAEQLTHHLLSEHAAPLIEGDSPALKAAKSALAPAGTIAALRVGDLDAKGNAIAAGSGDVHANGLPLARLGDAMVRKGVQVFKGSEKTLANGIPAAQAPGSLSAEGVSFPKASPDVFIGGATIGADPPPPLKSEVGNAASQAPETTSSLDQGMARGSGDVGDADGPSNSREKR
ncbi:MAG: hypothetical protein ACF8SC_06035, partial [Phycisphaerales bacterium JB037]